MTFEIPIISASGKTYVLTVENCLEWHSNAACGKLLVDSW
jgi:hypothetical protein